MIMTLLTVNAMSRKNPFPSDTDFDECIQTSFLLQ
jgi:hypothetical protein